MTQEIYEEATRDEDMCNIEFRGKDGSRGDIDRDWPCTRPKHHSGPHQYVFGELCKQDGDLRYRGCILTEQPEPAPTMVNSTGSWSPITAYIGSKIANAWDLPEPEWVYWEQNGRKYRVQKDRVTPCNYQNGGCRTSLVMLCPGEINGKCYHKAGDWDIVMGGKPDCVEDLGPVDAAPAKTEYFIGEWVRYMSKDLPADGLVKGGIYQISERGTNHSTMGAYRLNGSSTFIGINHLQPADAPYPKRLERFEVGKWYRFVGKIPEWWTESDKLRWADGEPHECVYTPHPFSAEFDSDSSIWDWRQLCTEGNAPAPGWEEVPAPDATPERHEYKPGEWVEVSRASFTDTHYGIKGGDRFIISRVGFDAVYVKTPFSDEFIMYTRQVRPCAAPDSTQPTPEYQVGDLVEICNPDTITTRMALPRGCVGKVIRVDDSLVSVELSTVKATINVWMSEIRHMSASPMKLDFSGVSASNFKSTDKDIPEHIWKTDIEWK